MAKSAEDTWIKASAQKLGLPKKALKKAVHDAVVRLVAERIAREQIDSSWQEIADRARQPPKPKAKAVSKAQRASTPGRSPSDSPGSPPA